MDYVEFLFFTGNSFGLRIVNIYRGNLQMPKMSEKSHMKRVDLGICLIKSLDKVKI